MLELLNKGGPVMWVLAVTAVVAVMVFLERLFHLHRAQIKSDDFLKGIFNIVRRGNIAEAISICDETPGPVASIVRAAVLHYDEPKEEIQKAIEEAGLAEVPRLERNLNLLGTIAKISPLLGLLGTVLGMIQMFLSMQRHAPLLQAGDLGEGLWQALVTTATGLAIAIPAYAGYNFLIGRVETILLDMERISVNILAFLARKELWREPGAP